MITIDLLENSFELMEKEGKVNLDISLPILDKISKEIHNLKEQRIKEKYNSPQKVFEIHHLSLVTLIVLNSIRNRLILSTKDHDNPISVSDSLKVLPEIKEAFLRIDQKDPDETFLELASQIQLNASQNKLFNLGMCGGDNLNGIFLEIAKEIELS